MAETKRVRRAPINGTRNKLTLKGEIDPNYVYRHVLEDGTGERVFEMKERGYEPVESKGVSVGDKRVADPSALGSVVTTPSGTNKLILMRIKKEFYEEDQALKQAEVDRMEGSIKNPNQDGFTGKVTLT